ncbi:biopolymer transporter ExbD [Kiritimatiellaeota bacterium B1221]|nr:biopolymer transporter ExbD [Kiritimatiellaeota bacterium B1221]
MKHSDIAHYRQLNSLRRRFMSRGRRFPPSIEPAAMVDVVLLVLMFFMISSSYVTRPGVEISLPVSDRSVGIQMNAMVVTLTRNGLVFFNDQRTNLDDLPAALERARIENPDLPLVIEADESVTVSTQMKVVGQANRAGILDIALATRGGETREEF